jgi:hypothetical protein
MSASTNGSGPLRAELAAAMDEHACSMKELTVLSEVRDPYRLDTPAKHRDGLWFARQVARFLPGGEDDEYPGKAGLFWVRHEHMGVQNS